MPGDIKGDDNHHQWYCPTAVDTPEPSTKVTWNESTKPPAVDQSKKSIDFQLGMNVLYRCGNKANVTVVYEGASARLGDSNRLSVYDSNLQLLDQKITFCGVGAHPQNGIIENKTKLSQQEDEPSSCTAEACGPT